MTNISTNPSDVKIGWIGTGIMGAPMAMHLVDAGYNVSVYSRTKSKSEKLIAKGCDWGMIRQPTSLKIVILYLPLSAIREMLKKSILVMTELCRP